MRAIVCGLLLASSCYGGSYLNIQKETTATRMSAVAINSAAYTGWIPVPERRSVVLEINYTRSSGTAVTMTCQTSDSAATANGSGFDIHIITDGTPVGTSVSTPHTWSYTTSSSKKWTWTITNLPHDYINCALTATAGGAGDTVVVKSRGVSP